MKIRGILSGLFLFFSGITSADVTIRYDLVTPNWRQPAHKVAIKHELVRLSHLSSDNTSVLIDLATGEIVQIHPQSRSYFRTSTDAIQDYITLYQQNRTWIQGLIDQGIQHLEPAKREQIRLVLDNLKRPMHQPLITLHKTQSTDQILNVKCHIVELHHRQQHIQDICLANPSDLELRPTDALSLERLKRRFSQIPNTDTSPVDQWMGLLAQALQQIDGLPLKFVNYGADGNITQVIEAGAISQRMIPAQAYRIPAGYQEQLIPLL